MLCGRGLKRGRELLNVPRGTKTKFKENDMNDKELKKPARNVLGRGLSALISAAPVSVVPSRINQDAHPKREMAAPKVQGSAALSIEPETAPVGDAGVKYVPIAKVVPNPKQPRRDFKEQELKELSDSIKTLGVLQPVLVRKTAGDTFEIVAGERRWRAATAARLTQLPVIIRDLSDRETLEISIVENVQREDLNPVEEALGYQRLVDEFNLSQKDVADKVGKDRASVANLLRLLKLPQEVLALLKDGQITVGHAKAILSVREPAAQISLAKKVIAESLSVRALEAIVSRAVVLEAGRKPKTGQGRVQARSAFPEVVDRLRNILGTKVSIIHSPAGRGRVEIEYFSEQELDRLVEIICKENRA